jgi:hypothetical protein
MPKKKLTDLFVERVTAGQGTIEYFDSSFPALSLRVTEHGSKSWCLFYRPAMARKEAQGALERIRQGGE